MKHLLSLFLAAGMAFALPLAQAETAKPAAKKVVKKPASKSAKKSVKAAAAPAPDDEPVPDIAASSTSEFKCPNNHSIIVYRNASDEQHAAMRWNNRLYGMRRITTESGAERLENRKQGLVFIGIPAKAMLLDSIKGAPLINDCVMASAPNPLVTDKAAESITAKK